MTDNTSQPSNPGRIHEVHGHLVAVQFAPNATPSIFSSLSGIGNDRLCVVRQLPAGRIEAISTRPASIWTPG